MWGYNEQVEKYFKFIQYANNDLKVIIPLSIIKFISEEIDEDDEVKYTKIFLKGDDGDYVCVAEDIDTIFNLIGKPVSELV